jgi:hypothetical protein
MLTERDIVTPAGRLNRKAMLEIATYRGWQEHGRYIADFGEAPPLRDLIARELRQLRQTAAVMVACRRQQAALDAMPPQERLVRQIELRLEILRNGLGQPIDKEAIAHHAELLAQARAAVPTDPGMLLAEKLRRVA